MIQSTILPELGNCCPEMALGQIQCKVINTPINKDLWEEIAILQDEIRKNYQLDTIKHQLQIAATRMVYKVCGKDPNRYRPSAESLYRRIVKGNDLYQISTLVDLINLFSLKTGYSIGGFDADIIEGDLTAGVGKTDEPFEGIGRGTLNIEGLPVLRDTQGAIGTPTSDEVRSAIRMETSHFFMNINGYTDKKDIVKAMESIQIYLKKYVQMSDMEVQIISYNR